ncbi:MAG: enoyl-CoA hydratase-related protein [Planctomycetota bacterium]
MEEFKKIKQISLYQDQVLKIILNHPKGNVIDIEMMSEINHVLQHHAMSRSVKAIIFQGEGKHFSFGASVQEHQKEKVREMLYTFHQLFRNLILTYRPTFALVQGQCLGGGMELASFCHWLFAAEDTNFGQPEMNLGVFPPVASLILPSIIGQQAADDLILTGRTLSAREAKEIGLVYSISPDPEKELLQFLENTILPKSAIALQFAVKASRYEMYRVFLENLESLEKWYLKELMETNDANEGIRAFIEKRKPIWKNC